MNLINENANGGNMCVDSLPTRVGAGSAPIASQRHRHSWTAVAPAALQLADACKPLPLDATHEFAAIAGFAAFTARAGRRFPCRPEDS
ncbi:hypothetical protein [Williamsia sterculiae]|uniref:Uncharacterized protein n=1 Tax=Williamsia sterculiae TaxID=1344003 RepID=A0A1N7FXV4_9NOCA|nr:hypothetical protein [Williamsia sterculiae]SIS05203.1 hypothetical protein SAMN05445060_2397 [Williamsia sterculiae]